MCYPVAVQRVTANVEVTRFSKKWNPLQIVKSINKSLISNGIHISHKIAHATGKAKKKAVKVKKWVVNFTFSTLAIPLVLLAFLLLLHPHREIQVGVVLACSVLALLFLVISGCRDQGAPQKSEGEVRGNVSLALLLYSILPLSSLSRAWGFLAATNFPQPVQFIILWIFSAVTGCNRSECELQLHQYKSLSQFFTRRLKPNIRPVCRTSLVVSPADGTITNSAPLKNGCTQLVKGLTYSLDFFLGSLDTVSDVIKDNDDFHYNDFSPKMLLSPQYSPLLLHAQTQLYETTVYLSPGDYHRFHSPADWKVSMRRHFPGTLFSVSPSIVKLLPSCLVTNERVAWYGSWKFGTFIMVAVAATNVGDISADFDPEISTNNQDNVEVSEKIYEEPIIFRRGDDFGYFNFGSTLVLIYEAPFEMNFGPNPVRRVKMGENIASIKMEENSVNFSSKSI